ncbi:hypothetical protein DFJ77DRAFT_464369 [Powellomyces hirtus]|nr:hypothetical protein DFJ77DRAFT_464369 [Powellomyces hirtus]
MAATAYGPKFAQLLSHYVSCKENNSNGIAHSADVAVDLEQSLAALKGLENDGEDQDNEEDADTYRGLLEASVKSYVDLANEIHAQKTILEDMRRRLMDGEAIENGDLVGHFEHEFERAKQQWANKSEQEKYHVDEAYVEFKQKTWEQRYPNRPFSLTTEGGSPDHDDEEEGLAIISQHESLKCPLTQMIYEDPVTSQVCKHSYSSKAITQHIRMSQRTEPHGRAECPVAGCKHYVALIDLKHNKKLARAAARRRAQAENEEEEDEEEYTFMD